jgi:hypothetical protein
MPLSPAAILLVDLGHVAGFLGDRLQPVFALLRRAQGAGAIDSGAAIVLPGRIGNQSTAFDPVHVVEESHSFLHIYLIRYE